MELNEAVRRIVGRHWVMIVLVVALGVGLAALLHRGDEKTYTASTRLVLDTSDPESSQQSAAIGDAAKAIATSPAQVSRAITRAGVTGRDPIDVARDHVSVRTLGTSAVLRLSVSDRNPKVAAAIANALATQLIRTRLGLAKGEVQRLLSGLGRRIEALDQEISQLDSAAQPQPGGGTRSDRARRADEQATETQALRTSLTQRRAALEAERIGLLSTDAVRPQPSIISAATAPQDPDSSRLLPDMILGALLGLVLGLGLAGVRETLRPTVVGGDALARELDTPLLGRLPGPPDSDKALAEAGGVAERLSLAVKASDVHVVDLLGAGPPVDLRPLAGRLEANPALAKRELAAMLAGPGSGLENATAVGDTDPGFHTRSFVDQHPSLNDRGVTALVLVAPEALKKTELADTRHLLRVTGLPLLGLITYAPSRWKRRHPPAAVQVRPEP